MSLIEMNCVEKNYCLGNAVVHAIRNVSLKIDQGEFIAVWGPSGSGKTTLLNLIGAIDEPTFGKIYIKGRDITEMSDNQRTELRNKNIGFIFQTFNLIPVLTAMENIMLPLQIKGASFSKAKRVAKKRLEDVGLSNLDCYLPDRMSGGQRQRVAIARALVTNPSLVIADEPTANLDSENAKKIIKIMRRLNEEGKTTFLFSTHDDRLLGRVDRLMHLQDGQITNGGINDKLDKDCGTKYPSK